MTNDYNEAVRRAASACAACAMDHPRLANFTEEIHSALDPVLAAKDAEIIERDNIIRDEARKLRKRDAEIEKLRAENERLNKVETDYTTLLLDHNDLVATLARERAQLMNLQSQLAARDSDVAFLNGEMDERLLTMDRQKLEINKLKGNLAAAKAEITSLNRRLIAVVDGRTEMAMLLDAANERIKELETSMTKHFRDAHLSGDGPEIDRWKRKVWELEHRGLIEGSTTKDYRMAISGSGPLASEWADKPHRLIYDLCNEVEKLEHLAAVAGKLERRNGERRRMPPVIAAELGPTDIWQQRKADRRKPQGESTCEGECYEEAYCTEHGTIYVVGELDKCQSCGKWVKYRIVHGPTCATLIEAGRKALAEKAARVEAHPRTEGGE